MHLREKGADRESTIRESMKGSGEMINLANTINNLNRTNTIGIGIQEFLELREKKNFYIDKRSGNNHF